MAKKRKKRRSFVPESEAKTALKKSFSEFNWKLLGKLLLCFAVIFGFYQFGLKMAEIYQSKIVLDAVVIIYVVAATVLGAAFVIINKGVSNDIPTKEQLNDDMTVEEKEKFIEDIIASRAKAKKLLLVLIPLIFTLLFDMIYLLFL